MGSPPASSVRHFPRALLATSAVIGLPVFFVSVLRATGTFTSLVPLVATGIVLSLAVSYVGARVWARIHSGDVVFAELMLWGWLRRWRLERQLAGAIRLLGLEEGMTGLRASGEMAKKRQVRALKQLSTALEDRYPDTAGHSRRVARHATAIAKRMGLPREEVTRIRTAACVHDIGKVDLPATIINKPGKLTDAEFSAVKQHPTIGAEMVASLGDEQLASIVRHHHERLDGRGYPAGLEGDEIPLGARIIAVADTFDAVTSSRPYRAGRRHKQALALLAVEAGTQLDPAAVRAFRRYYVGYRPVALWALALNGPRQLLASLAAEAKLGAVVTAVTLASVVVGNVALQSLRADKGDAQTAEAGASEETASTQRLISAGLLGSGGKPTVELRASNISSGAAIRSAGRHDLTPLETGKDAAGPGEGSSPASSGAVRTSGSGANGSSNSSPADNASQSTSPASKAKGKGSEGSHGKSESANGKSEAANGNGGAGGGNSHSGESVSVPENASDTAKSAVEGIVKGGSHAVSSPPPPLPSPDVPEVSPPGKGKSGVLP